MHNTKCFTVKSTGGLLRVLITPTSISEAYDPATDPVPKFADFKALWDTGATGSVITQEVVDALGLQPTGRVQVHGVAGETTCDTYLVSLRLPNAVEFPELKVTKGILGAEFSVLIGMDIINQGDFSMTNSGGKTVFSFRVPPMVHIDYVAEQADAARRLSQSHGPGKSGNRKRGGKSR